MTSETSREALLEMCTPLDIIKDKILNAYKNFHPNSEVSRMLKEASIDDDAIYRVCIGGVHPAHNSGKWVYWHNPPQSARKTLYGRRIFPIDSGEDLLKTENLGQVFLYGFSVEDKIVFDVLGYEHVSYPHEAQPPDPAMFIPDYDLPEKEWIPATNNSLIVLRKKNGNVPCWATYYNASDLDLGTRVKCFGESILSAECPGLPLGNETGRDMSTPSVEHLRKWSPQLVYVEVLTRKRRGCHSEQPLETIEIIR